VKKVGMVRNRYPKEATVFRVKLSNALFLRSDHSVDLYKARIQVVLELQRVVGEVRDYNGGMISRQLEVLKALKESLGDVGKRYEIIVENFFHSLFPIELRGALNPQPLKSLFLLLLELIDKERKIEGKSLLKEENNRVIFLCRLEDPSDKKKIVHLMERFQLAPPQLISLHFKFFDAIYLGYIYFCDDQNKQNCFIKELTNVEKNCY
jgi:hypothetical protein